MPNQEGNRDLENYGGMWEEGILFQRLRTRAPAEGEETVQIKLIDLTVPQRCGRYGDRQHTRGPH